MQGCSKNEPFRNCVSQWIFSVTPSLAVIPCAKEKQAPIPIKSASLSILVFNKTMRVWRKSTMKTNSTWAQLPLKGGQKGQTSLSITILNVPLSPSLFSFLLKPRTWYFSQLSLLPLGEANSFTLRESGYGTCGVPDPSDNAIVLIGGGSDSSSSIHRSVDKSDQDADQDDVCWVVLMLIIKTYVF